MVDADEGKAWRGHVVALLVQSHERARPERDLPEG
jgi:hypothetical protein